MPPLLSDRTIAALRTIAERAMQDTATIVRPSWVSDGGGSVTRGPDTTFTTSCTFIAVSALPPVVAENWSAERGKYQATVPLNQDVRVTDEFRVGDSTYRVVWAPQPGALDVERTLGLEDR